MDNVTKNRDRYIGGSDCTKIMTEPNLYKFAKQKLQPTFEGNEYTYYGQFMEPIIRQYINYHFDADYQPDTFINHPYRGNCDGIDYHIGKLIEIKTHGGNQKLEYHLPQVQCYMNLFNVKTAYLVTYERPNNFFTWGDITSRQSYNLEFDLNRLEIYEIQHNPKLWKKIDRKARKFAKALQTLRMNRNLTERDFNIIMYGKKLVETVEQYQETKYLEKLCEKEDIRKVQIGDVILTRTEIREITIDTKKLSEENPDIFKDYKIVTKRNQIKIRRKKHVTN
jgi:hypothetical protein